jgi:arylsulfatase A-like enzyme
MEFIANLSTRLRGGLSLIVAVALTLAVIASGARLLTSDAALASPAATPTPTDPGTDPAAGTPPEMAAPATGTPSAVRNIVFILADDLDTATFEQVPRLKALHAQGLTLRNMVVTDSLCCPSRTSILRSQYVHNHGVVSNLLASNGGWATFAQKGEEEDCLPVWLHAAGIQTAFLGKYLNGYGEDGDPTAIPTGWDRWFVPTTKSGMYRGYGYTVNDDRRLVSYAAGRDDFLNDVLTDKAVDFISTARSPFYLQVNSTAPHDPAPVARRHQDSHPRAQVPRTRSFNARGTGEPGWRGHKHRIGPKRIARYDAYWRQRVQSTESIADTFDAVTKALREAGTLDSTLIVIGSDNGYHAGSRRLSPGKRTAYREDTIVPTILIGPGIVPGSETNAMTSTIDLAPTFAELLGATVPDWVDGRSLVPLFTDTAGTAWRTGVLSESMGDSAFNDPDFQAFKPPKFRALRTQRWLYVEYADGSRELFDRAQSNAEVDNVLATTPPGIVADLSSHLSALSTCAGATCRTADTW